MIEQKSKPNLMASTPMKQPWIYTVKPGDGLMAIVRKEFKLKDPQDSQEINRLVDLIVAQNRAISRDKLKVGDKLTLNFSENPPPEQPWTYKVKSGDGLMAIVRREFKLKEPQDSHEINRRVDLIVSQNPGITRDKIKVGQVLKASFNESEPPKKSWTYKVKSGDGLMAIVRKEFKLKDPQNTQEIKRLVNLIVAQNGIKNPDSLKVGQVLTLHD